MSTAEENLYSGQWLRTLTDPNFGSLLYGRLSCVPPRPPLLSAACTLELHAAVVPTSR